jgi:hypothetical protein
MNEVKHSCVTAHQCHNPRDIICLSGHKIAVAYALRFTFYVLLTIRNPKSAIRNGLQWSIPSPTLTKGKSLSNQGRTPAAAKGRMERRMRYVGTGSSLWQLPWPPHTKNPSA